MVDSSLGRLICAALAMPTIARVMGAILLHLSHVVPLVNIIIASGAPPSPLLRLLLSQPPPSGDDNGSGESGTTILSRFLATSQVWAMSDPVWYGVFFFFFSF